MSANHWSGRAGGKERRVTAKVLAWSPLAIVNSEVFHAKWCVCPHACIQATASHLMQDITLRSRSTFCASVSRIVASCPAQVLEAMAQSPSQAVRRRFFQLRVMDYVTRELCLEMELAASDPLKGGSSTPAAQSGRSSGLPTPSTLQVPPVWRRPHMHVSSQVSWG